ncbi:hypothetical protein F0L68_29245 [Solihabitans fulvus]|uniref:Uncharacterized protein n=1 Tax=Solihabitans fulvus TaxID=1892852 RepID=A0A5B2WVI4_9PSEU|nr:hypothetical protein [Solihabitans fulvus]KAA2254870.1 hypothetical protein F0L68_29245 [Solihabitans fulvus]
MEASPRAHGTYYRCPARTLAPGSLALASHPPAVYLREDVIQDAVDGWLGELFAPKNLDRTVAALVSLLPHLCRRPARTLRRTDEKRRGSASRRRKRS